MRWVCRLIRFWKRNATSFFTTKFACYFAINGWFRVFVVATYLSICLTPKTLYLTVSHQNILANCDVIHLNRQPPVLFLCLKYLNLSIIVCFSERNGGSHPAVHFCVCGICIITNNVVFVKYRTQNPMQSIHPYSPQTLVLSVTAGHIPPPIFVHIKYVYSSTTLYQ